MPRLLPALIALVPLSASRPQQAGPPPPRARARAELVELLTAPEPALERFVDERLAPALRADRARDELVASLRAIAEAVRGRELAGVAPEGPWSATLTFEGGGPPVEVAFEIAPEPPHPFVDVSIEGRARLDPSRARPDLSAAIPLSWSSLARRLEAEEEQGFCGAVLVVRDGRIVLSEGYGLADRERAVPWRPDTVFAIGSTPIDFTKAAVLRLAERGALALGDPLGKWFERAPEAQRAITVEQLMTGRSGLPDFLGSPGDPDPDHAWIDRDEALRRIFAAPLRFAPGTRSEHSHAAWGVLAAIVEVASGKSWQRYLREELFAPAGMRDTGFFGEAVPEERLAVGEGDLVDGARNAPPYWGPTSWLVLGSGGMTSTLGDLCRWHEALRRGDVLAPASLARYWAPPGAVLEGGDAFGFSVWYTEGARDRAYVATNSALRRRAFRTLARELVALVQRGSGGEARFALGLELEVDDRAGYRVRRVVPGGAAERAGLRAGDRLVALDGKPLEVGPAAFARQTREGEPARLTIERDGKRIEVELRPLPR